MNNEKHFDLSLTQRWDKVQRFMLLLHHRSDLEACPVAQLLLYVQMGSAALLFFSNAVTTQECSWATGGGTYSFKLTC